MTYLAAENRTAAGLFDDETLVRRIFTHLDNRTTDLSDATWHEPVANYLSADRLSAEIHHVLRRCPTPFCPSVALPEPGSYVARDTAGTPLVAVRGTDGAVRVFRNGCRHRGAAVATGSGCARSLVCPFHGWVYRLDGTLRHVPDEYGFPGLDKETRGLVGLEVQERNGLVFVTQDGPRCGSLDRLPALLGPDHELLGSSETVVETNWKVLLEGFLEGYHIKATHTATFFPYGYDNLNVIERVGHNSRVTFPFRRIEALRDRPATDWAIDGVVTCVHQLFPNVIVAQLSHHTTVAILEPVTPDRTRLVSYELSNRHGSDDARRSAERDAAFVAQGTAEDRAMAVRVQRGLASGANDTVEFGRFEGAIVHFHQQLNSLLAAARPDWTGRPEDPTNPLRTVTEA